MVGGKGDGGREGGWRDGGMEEGYRDRIGMEEGRVVKGRKSDGGRRMDGRKEEGWRMVSGRGNGACRHGWSWVLVAVRTGERSACPRSCPRH